MPLTLMIMIYLLIILAVGLLIISVALCSRHIADLDYQRLTMVDEIRNIECKTGIRTHANRAVLALSSAIIALLNLSSYDKLFVTYTCWSLAILVVVTFLVSGFADWYAEYKKLTIFLRKERLIDANAEN